MSYALVKVDIHERKQQRAQKVKRPAVMHNEVSVSYTLLHSIVSPSLEHTVTQYCSMRSPQQ